uniref:Uncharacterized protein n=1 Tax=Fagus sylvatica TaxID=28930 RepID=A0A2N9EVT0_FAGSY
MTEVTMRCSASSGEMTPEEERITIRDIAVAAEANSKEGDTFYLITQSVVFTSRERDACSRLGLKMRLALPQMVRVYYGDRRMLWVNAPGLPDN